ncbi:Alpha/Beta hydrolase protein [Scleroderma yunnanense]
MSPGKLDAQEMGAEYPTMFDASSCTRRGLCPVSQIGDYDCSLESHSLYYEIHGNGVERIVFIMGKFNRLNSTSSGWLPQVQHFGKLPQYSVLVFDNRGTGNSTTPWGPYSTTSMAEDVIALLDFVGWTGNRGVHVVGMSLGGMIAQELAYRIPERIVSLSLLVTRAGGQPWDNLPPLTGISLLARLLLARDTEGKIGIILDTLFPSEWLDQKADDDPEGRTNKDIQTGIYRHRIEITRPPSVMGVLSQMMAGLTHNVSPDKLRKISAFIPKVLILTGDTDMLVDPSGSVFLKRIMPEAEFHSWEQTGHAVAWQRAKWFNALMERVIQEGRAATEKSFDTD